MLHSSMKIPDLCNKFLASIRCQRPGLIPIYYVPFCAYKPKSWCLPVTVVVVVEGRWSRNCIARYDYKYDYCRMSRRRRSRRNQSSAKALTALLANQYQYSVQSSKLEVKDNIETFVWQSASISLKKIAIVKWTSMWVICSTDSLSSCRLSDAILIDLQIAVSS